MQKLIFKWPRLSQGLCHADLLPYITPRNGFGIEFQLMSGLSNIQTAFNAFLQLKQSRFTKKFKFPKTVIEIPRTAVQLKPKNKKVIKNCCNDIKYKNLYICRFPKKKSFFSSQKRNAIQINFNFSGCSRSSERERERAHTKDVQKSFYVFGQGERAKKIK